MSARRVVLTLLLLLCESATASDPVRAWQRAIDRDDALAINNLLDTLNNPARGNEKGKNALMVAAKTGDFKLLDRLQRNGLLLQTRSNTGGTVLMYAILGNQLPMATYLLQSDTAHVNARSTNGWTALMIASAKGFQQAAQLLVENGADPNIDDAYLWSPLMRAIDNRHAAVVNYLLSLEQLNVGHQNENRATALHVAASVDDVEAVRQLLSLGANSDLVNAIGQRAIDIARAGGNKEMLRVLER